MQVFALSPEQAAFNFENLAAAVGLDALAIEAF